MPSVRQASPKRNSAAARRMPFHRLSPGARNCAARSLGRCSNPPMLPPPATKTTRTKNTQHRRIWRTRRLHRPATIIAALRSPTPHSVSSPALFSGTPSGSGRLCKGPCSPGRVWKSAPNRQSLSSQPPRSSPSTKKNCAIPLAAPPPTIHGSARKTSRPDQSARRPHRSRSPRSHMRAPQPRLRTTRTMRPSKRHPAGSPGSRPSLERFKISFLDPTLDCWRRSSGVGQSRTQSMGAPAEFPPVHMSLPAPSGLSLGRGVLS